MRLLNEVPENVLVDSLDVHPLLEQANPQRSDEELSTLQEQIQSEGRVREPLTVWEYQGDDAQWRGKKLVVDGFSRRRLVLQLNQVHNFSPLVPVNYAEFESIEHARYWIGINQEAKRNLTNEQRSHYYGKLYNELKNPSNLKAYLESKGRDMFAVSDIGEFIAELHRVSRRYIFKASDFYQGIEKIAKKNPEFASKILSRQVQDEKGELVNIPMQAVQKFLKVKKSSNVNSLEDLKAALRAEAKPKTAAEDSEEESSAKGFDTDQLYKEFISEPTDKRLNALVKGLQKVLKAAGRKAA